MIFLPAFLCATYLATRVFLRCWNPRRYHHPSLLDFLCAGLISCFALAYPLRWIPFIIGYLPQVTIPHKIRPLFYLLVGAALTHFWHEFRGRILTRLGWRVEPQNACDAARSFVRGTGTQTSWAGYVPSTQYDYTCNLPSDQRSGSFRRSRRPRNSGSDSSQ